MANAISQAKNMSAKSHGNDEDITCGVGNRRHIRQQWVQTFPLIVGNVYKVTCLAKPMSLQLKACTSQKGSSERKFEAELKAFIKLH